MGCAWAACIDHYVKAKQTMSKTQCYCSTHQNSHLIRKEEQLLGGAKIGYCFSIAYSGGTRGLKNKENQHRKFFTVQ